MVTVQRALEAGLVGLAALLAVLATTVGLSIRSAGIGLACGVVLGVAVIRYVRGRAVTLGPADLVTFFRATLTCAVAALVADSYLGQPPVTLLVALAGAALLLDAVDGIVARLTGTASRFGAKIDGEADAFLLLVLSVYVAQSVGAWVLAIGVVRYVFSAAGWVWPWMWAQLPYRYWRKPVTAVQGVVLVVVAAEVVAPLPMYAALGVALVLLTESFARDVLWLWRHRPSARVGSRAASGTASGAGSGAADSNSTAPARRLHPGMP
ncbi:CDP-alcohol phosphatidyltransferase family protein [Georgenia halophila]|uniref:CDP-alcohol phosphatidyltransferase family protein n=1 Tax=Georgenia halophila TaxID=620889 RepID=A0ABP8LN23_9MICO